MLRPFHTTSASSGPYRAPPQSSQGRYVCGMNAISKRIRPAPSQVGQRPPVVLKEKREAVYPRIFASGREAKKPRITSKMPRYVAGVERGVLPIGDWSTVITERNACG